MPRRYARVLLVILPMIAGGTLACPTAFGALGAPRTAPADDASLAPIRKITLYRSGVGYFERSGQVSGDAQIQLRFPTEQINDILKSMVLLDLGGGRIEAVSYGSKEPLARRLASFGVDISSNPSIPQLLGQLRGAPVKLTAGGETVSGTILGIEERPVQPTKDAPAYMAPYVNILAGGSLKSVAIASVSSFELLDKELAGELEKALGALAEYRADRTKTVDVRFGAGNAAGSRQVVVGYIHEMPVWKTSYRLILPDEAKGAADKRKTAALQGWAIVENNTDQDWEGVRLSLVSGRPVSFQMDLYEPLFVERPFVPVPTIPGVAPRAYQGGRDEEFLWKLAEAEKKAPESGAEDARAYRKAGGVELKQMMSPGRPGGTAGGQSPFQNDQDRGKDVSAADMADYAAAAQAGAAEVGEVFQYELEAPVTIERQRSAMIPILSASISGRRVSIFNLGDRSEHPMRGVEITNDSKLQLLPGPIAVFDGNDNKSAYAGDAQIGHIPAGDKRLLAYAVDLDVAVLTKPSSGSDVTKIRIVNGAFEQTSRLRETVGYAFENKDQARARTILVEHPRLPEFELVAPEKPAETTQGFYRFEMNLEPGKAGAISVVQERTLRTTLGIMNTYTMETLLAYRTNGKVSEKVIEAFRDAASRQSVIAEAERQVAELDKQIAEIGKDQGRIRENMGQIDRNSQLYTRYMTKLSEQETQLEQLSESRKKGQARVEQLRKDFEAFLRALNVE